MTLVMYWAITALADGDHDDEKSVSRQMTVFPSLELAVTRAETSVLDDGHDWAIVCSGTPHTPAGKVLYEIVNARFQEAEQMNPV